MQILRNVCAFACLCLASDQLFADEQHQPSLIKRIDHYQTVVKSITDLLRGYKGIDHKEEFQRQIDKLVANEFRTLQEQEEFAVLAFQISRMGSEPEDYPAVGFAFEEAFVAMLRGLANNKTEEATNAFRRIKQSVALDGGTGVDFEIFRKKQLKPKSN